MNITDVTTELVCINFCIGTEQLIMFRSGTMIIVGTECCIFIKERFILKRPHY